MTVPVAVLDLFEQLGNSDVMQFEAGSWTGMFIEKHDFHVNHCFLTLEIYKKTYLLSRNTQ